MKAQPPARPPRPRGSDAPHPPQAAAPAPLAPGRATATAAALARDFAGVTCWIFDLDNTLYPPETALFPQIEARMTAFVARLTGASPDEASRLRAQYWREHGTTLAGLMARHAVDPRAFLDDVHDIDLSPLRPDPVLAGAIAALPGRRIIHTNADAAYAGRVLAGRRLAVFDAICGIEETGFHPKPDPRSFAAVLAAHGINPSRAAMFEDDPRNLEVPFSLGMRTILVGPGWHGPDALPAGQPPGPHVRWHIQDLPGFVAALAAALQTVAD